MLAALLPELTLLSGVMILWLVNRFRTINTPKTFFTISKYVMIVLMLLTLIFYNRSIIPNVIENNDYTTLFKLMAYAVALVWFYVSLKWFLSKDINSAGFYIITLLSLLGLDMMISAVNLVVVFAGLGLSLYANYCLLKMNLINEANPTVIKRYFVFATLFMTLFAIGLVILYLSFGELSYRPLESQLTMDTLSWKSAAAIIFVLAALFFAMGVAPFHFWYADAVGMSILPVSGYLSLVPFIAYFACLGNLLANVFDGAYPIIANIMVIFGALSIILGAIGVLGEHNLRKIFAYGTLFNIGVIIIALSPLDVRGLLSAFVYLSTYVLAMLGIYTSFYGFKSRGVYLTDLDSIAGIYNTKPYITAAFLVFIVSLTGIPPMFGFLGRLSVADNLFYNHQYLLLMLIMVALLFLATGYFRVIRKAYFHISTVKFDRADKGIYITLLINIAIVVITLINPRYLMLDFEQVLISLFG